MYKYDNNTRARPSLLLRKTCFPSRDKIDTVFAARSRLVKGESASWDARAREEQSLDTSALIGGAEDFPARQRSDVSFFLFLGFLCEGSSRVCNIMRRCRA